MTITQAVAGVYLRATGKTVVLTSGTKYDRIVSLLDFFQRRWAREVGVDWNSLYDPAFSIGTVTATDAYDLDASTIRKLSDRERDFVRIMWTDGVGYTNYTIVDANRLKDYYFGQNKENPLGFYCAQVGNQLVFNHKFTTSDAQFGGNIRVPIYGFADAITSQNPNTDEVQVNDPDWLIVICAAEFVRNDITRRQRYPELLTEANEIMERMKSDNDSQVSTVDRPWGPFSGIGQEVAWS